jgi:hypothetical protein
LLKSFGPFKDTAENFADAMSDASEYNIEILPDGNGNVSISIVEFEEAGENNESE